MRALLVVNPKATATTERVRDVIARALGSELKVDVVETRARGHATELAREAAAGDVDVVVTLGGDGTVNEVVNGLLDGGPREDTPTLAVVPGGSANVFARALGGSRNPVEATADILDALRAGRLREVGLGLAGERWFTFCAGLGFDAEVVEAVERQRDAGRRASPGLYVRTAVRHFFTGTDRRHPVVTLEVPGEEPVSRLALAIVANTDPWTYLGARAVHPLPQASFDSGLDVLAPRRMRTLGSLRLVGQMLSKRPRGEGPGGRGVVRRHDLAAFTLRAEHPLALQVDGDLLEPTDELPFRSVPRALRVVA
jgi:diacylglycerol kinase family enzyme